MKLDITRAWKDESYRESLSAEQLRLLPANPAGELSEVELANISGGWGEFDHGFFTRTEHERHESVAVICEINIFSVNILNITVLASFTSVCEKG